MRDAPRTFRCPDELWEAALNTADRNDETLAQVLRKALRDYVEGHKKETGK